MQRPDMQRHDAGDHEGQEVVQRIEAVERRIADRVAAPQIGDDGVAHDRDRREQVGDHRGAPEAHLAPGQHIAHEGGRHHQEQDDDAQEPQELARRLIGAVIEAARGVDIGGGEEHRGAVQMQIAQQPAGVHVAHDVLDRVEGERRFRRVMHRQHDAGHDLGDKHEGQDAAEGPHVVEVARRRVGDEGRMHQTADRQPRLEPFGEGVLGNVSGLTAHGSYLCPIARLGVARGREAPLTAR